jgi:hypothetical protein
MFKRILISLALVGSIAACTSPGASSTPALSTTAPTAPDLSSPSAPDLTSPSAPDLMSPSMAPSESPAAS